MNYMTISQISDTRWLQLLDNLDFYPPFYSPLWLRAYEKVKKGYRAGAFEINCKETTYLFPYLESRFLIFKILYSNPLSTYGGPVLVSGDHDPGCLRRAMKYLSRRFSGILINFDPFNTVREEIFSGFRVTRGFTHVIDARSGFRFSGSFLRGVKKARREGVEVAVNEFVGDFLAEIFRRGWLDKRLQGKDFFFKELIESGCARLYSAVYRGEPIAHIYILFGRNYAFYHYGVARKEYLGLRPNNLLHYTVVRENGIYNLGSSVGLPGVEEFKRRMGAMRVSVVSIYRGIIPRRPWRGGTV